jgi:non-ribosomal peptide synthase protein (TIGR01720 family)
VLGLDGVTPDDDYFELGGDSILSIRIIARARTAGLQLKPSDLLENPTVAALAAVAHTRSAAPAPAPAESVDAAPMLPIQHWFAEQALAHPEHWNQAVLLKARGRLDPALVQSAALALIARHPALRTRFDFDARRQFLLPAPSSAPFSQKFVSSHDAVEAEIASLHARLDPGTGGVLHVAQFDTATTSAVALIAHHLVVDAISWRILVEDFQALCLALQRAQEPALPAVSTSPLAWAAAAAQRGKAPELTAEAAHWLAQASRSNDSRMPWAGDPAANTTGRARVAEMTLGTDLTRELLLDVHGAYNTQVPDLLLTALAQALRAWAGGEAVLIALEGHGREATVADLDVSRSVGWFTSVYPVRLALPAGGPGEHLLAVKETLRGIPSRGVGHGLLRHFGPDDVAAALQAAPEPEVLFNYLGRVDGQFEPTPLFTDMRDANFGARHPDNRRRYVIDIDCLVRQGALTCTFTYPGALIPAASIEELVTGFRTSLEALIAHCLSPDAGGRSASDFALAGLDADEFAKLNELLGG